LKNTYLYGKNSVLERLSAKPESIKTVYIQDNFNAPHIVKLIRSKGIPCRQVREKELSRIKRADRLQGIVAEVERFCYIEFNRLIARKDNGRLTLIFLDDINDPHNLGSILRITACMGGFGIIIPRHSSCEINDTVMHVASGGENYTPVSMVSNTLNALTKVKQSGYWIAGTVVKGGESIQKTKLPHPLAIVFGSEGGGIKPAIRKHLDLSITLDMKGAELSLNVAMAAAIFCYEINKQKQAFLT
jgi:23S rRNA (guanosine2251-2'-O)-methyltransferase